MLLVLLLVLPLLGGVVIGMAPRYPLAAWAAVFTNGAVLVLGVLLAVRVVGHAPASGAWGCSVPTR